LGCNFGAYFSTQSATLPAAKKTNNLTLRPFSIVTKIIYDKNTKKAKGVEIVDAETNQTYEFFAKVIFVCASALNSTWVLMNSATDVWEGGLGSSSGELGHNLMDHHFRCGAGGKIDGYLDSYVYGRRPTGLYVPRFVNVEGDTKKRDYVRGFGYQVLRVVDVGLVLLPRWKLVVHGKMQSVSQATGRLALLLWRNLAISRK
jgi:choline dehydrogenase-like flavoprotein